jgi:glycosyltransferase involved in cell wall biosynthesis
LRLLSERYEVTALVFYRRATARDLASSNAALREFAASVDAFAIPQEYSTIRLIRDHLESTIRQRVYTVSSYRSKRFSVRLSELLNRDRYELVHIDSLDLSAYLPMVQGIATVCTHHNVESELLRRRAGLEQSHLRRVYLNMQAELMRREEQRWCEELALNVVVSSDDRDALLRIAPRARVSVVPNGVDVNSFQPGPDSPRGIVFVGGMTWFPNRDALEHFARDILPNLRRLGCQDQVTWVGRALPGAEARYLSQGINLTGYVDDIRPIVKDSACYVVPLRVGGGTRLKILDAWAMGKAVVSTSIGCEGLDARDGWNIIVRDDPESFAAAVHQVISDTALRVKLGRNARLMAETTYSWRVIGDGMYADYEAIRVGARPGHVARSEGRR